MNSKEEIWKETESERGKHIRKKTEYHMKHEERKRQEQHEQQQNGRKKTHTLTNVLPGFTWTTSGAP